MSTSKNTKSNKRQTLASHINIPNLRLCELVFPSVTGFCLSCFFKEGMMKVMEAKDGKTD